MIQEVGGQSNFVENEYTNKAVFTSPYFIRLWSQYPFERSQIKFRLF